MTLEVRTHSPGDSTTFQFNVTVINISDKSIVQTESFSFMSYISNTTVSLTVVLTNGGSFSFNIIQDKENGLAGTNKTNSTSSTALQPPTQSI